MAVSLTWGILFFTNSLTVWNACILLILHGMAGALWAPPEQLLLEDFVGVEDLPSAIRLNSTARSLGVLAGPVVGSALLLGLGPVRGIWVNIAFYLPLTILMARTKFTGHTRHGIVARERVSALAAVKVFKEVSRDRVLASMIILAGLGSFFVGSAMQVVMPEIASTTTGLSSGTAYGVLLFANGLGGVLGGLILEGTGWVRLSVRSALSPPSSTGRRRCSSRVSHDYLIAAPLLIVGGVANLAALSITQTVVQLRAPREKKGQVIGVYGVGANGMRIGSGFTVGLFGAAVGLRTALGLSSTALVRLRALLAVYLAVVARRDRRGSDQREHSQTRGSEHTVTAIGFVGLGNMGGPRSPGSWWTPAVRFSASTCRPIASAPPARAGRLVAGSAVAAATDLVLLSYRTARSSSRRCWAGRADRRRARGSLVVDLSTASPESTRRISARLSEIGVDYLDAGISGGAAAAEKGALTLMVGGPASALETARPVLEVISARIFHCGDSGACHTTKLLNNFLNAVSLAATAEVMVAGKKAGLDLEVLLDVITSAPASTTPPRTASPRSSRATTSRAG